MSFLTGGGRRAIWHTAATQDAARRPSLHDHRCSLQHLSDKTRRGVCVSRFDRRRNVRPPTAQTTHAHAVLPFCGHTPSHPHLGPPHDPPKTTWGGPAPRVCGGVLHIYQPWPCNGPVTFGERAQPQEGVRWTLLCMVCLRWGLHDCRVTSRLSTPSRARHKRQCNTNRHGPASSQQLPTRTGTCTSLAAQGCH